MRTRLVGVATVLVAAMLAASCGSDDDDGTTASTEPGGTTATTVAGSPSTSGDDGATAMPDDMDPDGVLRLGWDLVQNGGPQLDPIKSLVSAPYLPVTVLYDGLLRVTADGEYVPGLAREVTVVDPQTITIELNEGITFTDGTALDAEAVKFSVERNKAAQNTALSVELQDISAITVDGPLSLTLELASPIAGAVYDRIPFGDFAVVSPTAARSGADLNVAPVGAGPFMLDRIEPGRMIRMKKNPDHFQADQIKLSAIEFVHVEPGQARITAIQSGAVDATTGNFSYEQSKALAGSGWEVDAQATSDIMLWGQMCKSRPPFDDVRVRQAINYAIDRDAVNASVYDGLGAPMWGFFDEGSPYHDPSLDGFYAHDVEKAKALLAEAGQTGLTFDTFFSPGASQRAVEIMQAQMAEAGITMNLKTLTNSAEFFPDAKGAPINIFPLERQGIQKVARTLVPGSVGNICGWDDPELNGLVNDIKAVAPDSPEAVELWHDLQRVALEDAVSLFVVFGARATAYDPDRLADVEYISSYTGQQEINVRKVYVKE